MQQQMTDLHHQQGALLHYDNLLEDYLSLHKELLVLPKGPGWVLC